jgi:hypothetical protein
MRGRYEPIIVKTLRRFVRRGAPQSLLQRIAGGPADWRVLNTWWNLDGTAVTPPVNKPRLPLGTALPGLSAGERRIALMLIADEAAEAGATFPTSAALAALFDVSYQQISDDLHRLREGGKLAWHLRSDGSGVRRSIEPASAGTET